MREIRFKGKSILKGSEGQWVEGYYYKNYKGKDIIYSSEMINGWFSHPINPETLCQYTGKKTIKGNDLFENDIVFEEIEEESGDRRIYFVCKWIEEWGGFTFLLLHELFDYEDNGIKGLDEQEYYNIEDAEKLHYAGNYIDNPELLER